jgi:hypothetical protein
LFLFCFCVLASGTKAQTTPSREYNLLGTRVIAIENIPPAVAAPSFFPAGGQYKAAQTVRISTATAGATIGIHVINRSHASGIQLGIVRSDGVVVAATELIVERNRDYLLDLPAAAFTLADAAHSRWCR